MSERIPTVETALSLEKYLLFAESLAGISEKYPFPFSGIEENSYLKLKAESDEFPDMVTPIDVLIERFKAEGIKIVVVNGKAFVLPGNSTDVENDSIFPRHLKISEDMDRNLVTLIKSGKQRG